MEKRKGAILKVEGLYKGIRTIRATAFFVSKDGYIISTDHMFGPLYQNNDTKNWTFKATDIKGNEYTKISRVLCSDNDNLLDICVLKINEPMKSAWIPLDDSKFIALGEKNLNSIAEFSFKTFGNPAEGDFIEADVKMIYHDPKPAGLSNECIRAVKDHKNSSILVVEISDPEKRYGFSGAPLLNIYGELVGMWKGLREGTYNPQNMKCDKTIAMSIPAFQLKDYYKKARERESKK